MKKLAYLSIVSSLLLGCGASEAASEASSVTSSRGVTQAGAQDIAHFRQVVAQGDVPSPALLDEVGFFAEHALDLPPADCGASVCVHPNLAVAPKFGGGAWTMAFIAMNTPVQPSEITREPMHLVVAWEDSVRLFQDMEPAMAALRAGLREDDTLTVLRFGTSVRTLGRHASPDDADLDSAIRRSDAETSGLGGAALYDALAQAGHAVASHEERGRILVVTSGQADAGITNADRLLTLSAELGRAGTPITVVGMGETYRAELATGLAQASGGNYYFAEGSRDLENIFEAEGETVMVPLATDLELVVTPSAGYRVGDLFGASQAKATPDQAILSSPALFMGQREGARDVARGRRGGGGGLFVELIGKPESGVGAGEIAFTVTTRYRDAQSLELVEMEHEVQNALAPGGVPDVMWPFFHQETGVSAFMMLNMYLALRTSTAFYEEGDCGQAAGVVDLMEPGVEEWQLRYSNPDTAADMRLLYDLQSNILDSCESVAVQPRFLNAGCFIS